MKLTGAQMLWESLVREGVTDVFGYPGGAILPAYDAMLAYPIRHILVRHEQGATHMADGYARASGRVGVAVATSGPGATNMVTGIATAMMDSSPIVCITGQVGSRMIGSDAFQETDITGITIPITKHNYLVTRAEDVAPAVREAFAVARSGRPGPVLVDITKDAQQGSAEVDWNAAVAPIVETRDDALPGDGTWQEAVDLINAAERPADPRRPRDHAVGRRAGGSGVRRARRHPDRRHAARAGRHPRVARSQPRHDGHARRDVGEPRDPGVGSPHRPGHAVRRPRHRQPQDLRAGGAQDPRRHRSRGAEQERARGRGHREGSADRDSGVAAAREAGAAPAVARLDRRHEGRRRRARHPESARQRPPVRCARDQRSLAPHRRQGRRRDRRGAAPDVGSAVLQARIVALAHHLGRARDDGFRAAGGDRRQGRVPGRRSVGRGGGRRLPDDARPNWRRSSRRAWT